MGVVKRRGRLSFMYKAGTGFIIPYQFVGQEFQGDLAFQLQIFGQVNFAHPAAA